MARPRRGKRRRSSVSDDWQREYLITGIEPADDIPGVHGLDIWALKYQKPEQKALWEALRGEILANWRKPGSRPWAWWEYDAPRMALGTFPGCFYDGTLPEPRRYLSGPGVPRHERLNYVPSQSFGLWDWFGDPDDPPVFESQFEYLMRHGLLLPGEDEPLPEPEPHPWQIESAARWAETMENCRRMREELQHGKETDPTR